MQLSDMLTEVRNHGFTGTTLFPDSRITQYLNNAYLEVARRVDYYADEQSNPITTVAGTQDYALPANWARVRNLRDIDRNVVLWQVGLREIDDAIPVQGAPTVYALSGQNLHLFPTPDNVYNLRLRYWILPGQLVAGTDTPTLPQDYHQMLVYAALAECYAGEDDPQTAQYWTGLYQQALAKFEADARFPSTDAPSQVKSMWPEDGGGGGWSRFGWGY